MLKVENCLLLSVVDTGSLVTLIDKKFVLDLKCKINPSNEILKTANGTILQNEGIVSLNVKLGNEWVNCDFLVINNLANYLQGSYVLLGSRFFEKYGICVNFNEKLLEINQGVEKCQIPFSTDNDVFCNEKVTVSQKTIISPNAYKQVNVLVPVQNGLYVVKPNLDRLSFPDYLVKVKNQSFSLLVNNNINRKTTLYPGQVIGLLCQKTVDPENAAVSVNFIDNFENDDGLQSLYNESINKIIIDSALENKDKSTLEKLISEYRSCFSESLIKDRSNFPINMDFEYEGKNPVYVRPYRTNFLQRKVIKDEISKLQEEGVIEPSTSCFCSPFMVIKKPDGKSFRCVCDLRKVNENIKPMKYPLPNLQTLLENAAGGTFYSSFDLCSGYHQMKVEESKRKYLAFAADSKLWQYTHTPMGLNQSGANFQMAMDLMFNGLQDKVLIYLDDILVVTKGDFSEHLEVLEKVLDRCKKFGLILKGSKTKLAQREIKFLGHYLDKDVVRTDPDKVKAISDFPIPRNVHDVRSFKGLINFYYRFCPELGIISKPLNELTGRNAKFIWTNEHQTAFDKLKKLMVGNTVLAHYNPESRIQIFSDASDCGVGGVINIETSPDVWQPVAYCSRNLSDHERKHYSVTEKELLAVLFVLDKFKYYLYGGKVEFFTDHKAIVFMLDKQKELSGRLARWCLKLKEMQQYVTFKFKKGKENILADCLSRNPILEMGGDNDCIQDVYAISVEKRNDFKDDQLADPLIQSWIGIMNNNQATIQEKRKVKDFVVKDGVLYRKCRNSVKREILQLVLPERHVKDVISKYHDKENSFHASVNKTVSTIQQYFYFRNMQEVVKVYITSCDKCQLYKESKSVPYGHLTERVFNKRGVCWQLDTIGPFIPDSRGNKYVITIVDVFSNFLMARAVKDIKTATIIRFLGHVLNQFKMEYLRTDLHRVFTSEKFTSYVQNKGVKLIKSLSYTPHTNGKVENLNKILKNRLAMRCSNYLNQWSSHIPKMVHSINCTAEELTKMSPYQLMYDELPYVSDEGKYPIENENLKLNGQEIIIQNDKVKEARHLQFKRNEKYFNKHHKKSDFKVGEFVKITHRAYEVGTNKGFKQKFTGPWVIVDKVGEVTFRVQLKDSPVFKLVHISQVRNYYIRD